MSKRRFALKVRIGDSDSCQTATITKPRTAWALERLMRAGERGCTPIDQPAPRWSAYIFELRTWHGIAIETVTEPHRGHFPGNHARYVLRSSVEILERIEISAQPSAVLSADSGTKQ